MHHTETMNLFPMEIADYSVLRVSMQEKAFDVMYLTKVSLMFILQS